MSNNIRPLVSGYVESLKNNLNYIVDFMYKNPETSLHEEKASELICKLLEDEGFDIDRNICGVKHSFYASYGEGKPTVAFICEYNSVAYLGQASGHNISCGINLGAALGLKRAIDQIGGRVVILGCPGEEYTSTKITFLEKGVFNGLDAIVCGHAMDKTCESGTSLGMRIIKITFIGKSAHTSMNTVNGVDALKPCITLFTLTNDICGDFKERIFINKIITNGGDSIDRIPGESQCEFMIKAGNAEILKNICDKILKCADFAGIMHSCRVNVEFPQPEYMPFKTHQNLSTISCHNLKEMGITNIHGPITLSASLDIGNASQVVPSIHPYIGICESPIPYYSQEFADCTVSDYAKNMMLKAACALALTGVDIIQRPEILSPRA